VDGTPSEHIAGQLTIDDALADLLDFEAWVMQLPTTPGSSETVGAAIKRRELARQNEEAQAA
jgi:hypothetical protein